MVQVKEFINYGYDQDDSINEWIRHQGNSIEIIDIKYSVGVLDNETEFSGVLIIYKENF